MKLCIYGALLLAVQPLAGCANDGGSSEPAVDRNVGSEVESATAGAEQYDELVVAFGDSLYAGYGLSQAEHGELLVFPRWWCRHVREFLPSLRRCQGGVDQLFTDCHDD